MRWTLKQRVPYWLRAEHGDDELYQAGIEGLYHAFRLYEPGKGASFKTFATHKIKWAMLIAGGLTRQGWPQKPARLPATLLGG